MSSSFQTKQELVVVSANVTDGSIVNVDIASNAAISYSKLNIAASVVNADVSNSAAIAYSKLNLGTSIVNADIAAAAAIALSKLASLTAGSIPFAGSDGKLTQDNANLFWDDANNRLGIGLTNPSINLDITTSGSVGAKIESTNGDASLKIVSGEAGGNNWLIQTAGTTSFGGVSAGRLRIFDNSGGANEVISILPGSGRVGFGTTVPNTLIDLGTSGVIASSTATQTSSGVLTFTSSEWTGAAEVKYRAAIQLIASTSANQSARLAILVGGTELIIVEETGTTRLKSTIVAREQSSTSTTTLTGASMYARNLSATVNNISSFAGTNANGTVGASFGVRHIIHSASVQDGEAFVATTNAGTTAEQLVVTKDGRIYAKSIHNNAGAMTGTTNQYIGSGTYTPTLTNVTNVGASTAYACQWMRVGNVVTVSGKVDIDAALAASTATELGVSLPIASNFAAEENLGGDAVSDSVASLSARIRADSTNDRAAIVFKAISLTNDSYSFTFTYLVL